MATKPPTPKHLLHQLLAELLRLLAAAGDHLDTFWLSDAFGWTQILDIFEQRQQRHAKESFRASHILISPGKCELSDSLVFLLFSKRFFLESAIWPWPLKGVTRKKPQVWSFQVSATHFDFGHRGSRCCPEFLGHPSRHVN